MTEPVRCYNCFKGEIKEINLQINAKLVKFHRPLISYIPPNMANFYFYGQKSFVFSFLLHSYQ